MNEIFLIVLVLLGAILPISWLCWVSLGLAGFVLLLFIVRFHYAATVLFLFAIGLGFTWIGHLAGYLHSLHLLGT